MRTRIVLLWLLTIAMPVAAGSEQLEAEARRLVDEFIGALKPQLQSALQEGGPAHAIAVCSNFAPRLADSLSVSSGWRVKRVSLKTRNPSRATPDTWERDVLQTFDERQRSGEKTKTLYQGQLKGGVYRYLQAQEVQAACLLCHGETVSGEVLNALSEYYPDDEATGYRLGQVRGAISLTRSINATDPISQD